MTFYVVAWGGLVGDAKHRTLISSVGALQCFIDQLAADPDIDSIIIHIHRDPPVDPAQSSLPE